MKLADKLAFPLPHQNHEHRHHGMTLREHYAGLAMQGMLADQSLDESAEECAKVAVLFADALITELEAKS